MRREEQEQDESDTLKLHTENCSYLQIAIEEKCLNG